MTAKETINTPNPSPTDSESHVGAGLLAKASSQSTSSLNDTSPSRASRI
ncbi:MAG TPA: manganese ABC transporter ATP-binding protein, partial [Pseudomonas sp.]|nr:manganese ABC transporter ATP-binding protein [Pseudomonas sp.]